MASCDPKSYSGVTPEVFGCLRQKLQSFGYDLSGTSGIIQGPMGISIQFNWDEAANTLDVQVLHKNFLIPCNRIYNELARAVDACQPE